MKIGDVIAGQPTPPFTPNDTTLSFLFDFESAPKNALARKNKDNIVDIINNLIGIL